MIRYEKAHPGEENKIVDFGNYVFSQSARPHDFRALLPKVYREGKQNAHMHYVAHDENGDIRAMVACLPLHMEIAGEKLLVGTVGTVSVHPYARGEGHMKHVMKLMQDDARAQGMDAVVLGGRRQRYNFFGYEHAGANAVFSLNTDNVRHALGAADDTALTFQKVEDGDTALIDQCYALYQKGLVRGARPREEYLSYMRSWNGTLVAILKDGRFVGALQECGTLGEVLLENESDLPAVIRKWFGAHPETRGTIRCTGTLTIPGLRGATEKQRPIMAKADLNSSVGNTPRKYQIKAKARRGCSSKKEARAGS